MSVSSLVHCIAVLFFHLSGGQTITPGPDCPAPCLCEKTSVFNCASLGLSTVPLHIPATAFSLDLSNNSLVSLAPLGSSHVYLPGLQRFWVGNNSLESLSLCLGRGVEGIRTLMRRNRKCVSWAPNLQLLSAERNQLTYLPRGLGSVKSLQVLELSHNRISELGPADLVGCTQLREVYLRHNLINTVHPQAFKDLQNLKVLDLSYNLLTSVAMPAYLSLRNLNALVDVSDNKWRCDCNLKMIRRWLTFDSELGNTTWKVVCSSPSYHSGKDLLSLDESELSCPQPVSNTPGINTMTVDEGMELSLPCANASQDLTEAHWWTPSGQVPGSQRILYLSNITEQHAGLYICASGFKQEHVSVFNVHVRKRVHEIRLRREAQNVFNDLGEENVNILKDVPAVRQGTNCPLALAVSLSVVITFIVAFVLGVVLRPYLDKLCVKIKKKRGSTASSNSRASSAVPEQYVNEGFSDTCEQVQERQRSSRVSFGGVTEVEIERDVEYDVPMEDDQSGNTDDDVIYQNVQRNKGSIEMGEVHTQVPLREANKKISEYPNAETDKVTEFEHIPDPDERLDAEERSISSASSCSSEDRVVQQSYEVNATEQSKDSPTAITHPDTILEFTADPFSGIPTFMTENMNEPDTDLWNDSGDSFSFTDSSPRLTSPVSHAVYDFPSFKKETSVDEQPNRPSSSMSSESEESVDYPTEYTINPETHGESETSSDSDHSENRKLSSPAKDITTEDQSGSTSAPFRQEPITPDPNVHMTVNHEYRFDDVPITEPKKSPPLKISLDYEDQPLHYRVHPVYRNSQEVESVLRTDSSDTSSSSDNEDKEAEMYPRRLEIKSEPDIYTAGSTPVKNSGMVLNINYDNTSSSTDIEDSSKARERRTFKGLSGLSALLFNRSGTEPNKKPVQSPPKPENTDSRSLIGSLGLYFKRQPSVDENITPTADEDNFFASIGQVIDHVPKLKKRLAFSIVDPQPLSPHGSTPKDEETFKYPVSSSMEGSFFEMIGEVSHPIPRVKRYLHFSAMLYPEAPPTADEKIIHKVEPNAETRRSSSSSESDISEITKEDDFFARIGASYEYLPKVKGYLQFSLSNNNEPVTAIQTESKTSTVTSLDVIPVLTKNVERRYSSESDSESESLPQPLYLPSKKAEATTQLGTEVKRKAASFEYHEPAADENNFFQKIGVSVDRLPKIRRYILFTAPPPEQPPFLSINRQITLETTTKPEFWRSSSVSVKPDVAEGMFFEQIGPCLRSTSLPKVKRYIEFSRFDSHSPSSLKQTLTPVGSTKLPSKTPSYSSDDDTNSSTSQDDFYAGIRVSLDKTPKVKRSLPFVQSEPQPSNHQIPSLKTEMTERQITVAITTKPEFWRSSSVSVKPDVAEGMFFEQIGPCLRSTSLPKVSRYIEFIRMDSHSPSSLKQTLTPVGSTKLPLKRPSYSSDDDTNSSTSQDDFYEGIRVSLDKTPKVKRSLPFVQSEPQPSNQHFPSLKTEMTEKQITVETTTKPEFWRSSLVSAKPDMAEGMFFEQIGPCLRSTSLPKVRRYIEFIRMDSHSPSSLKQTLTPVGSTKLPLKRPSYSSDDDTNSSSSQDDFYAGIRVSLDNGPKVKRSLPFVQSEPQPSNQHFPSLKTEMTERQITLETTTKPESWRSSSVSPKPDVAEGMFFEQIGPCLRSTSLPKVRRYIEFIRMDSHSPSSLKQTLTPVGSTKLPSKRPSYSSDDDSNSSSSQDDFYEGIRVSLDNKPKSVQSDPQRSNHQLPSLKTEITERTLVTHTQPKSSSSTFVKPNSQDDFFRQITPSIEVTPKVERAIQFSQSEVSPPSQPSVNFKRDVVRENINPTSKESNFFKSIGVSVDRVPKIKQYLSFTQRHVSTESPPPFSKKEVRPQLPARVTSSNTDSSSEEEDNSLKEMPTIKRPIQSKRSEPKSFIHTQTFSDEHNTTDEATSSTGKYNFFERIGPSLDNLPKVKRSLHFAQSEPQLFNPTTSPSSVRAPKLNQVKAEPFSSTWLTSKTSVENLTSVTDTDDGSSTFDRIQRPKKSLVFTHSDTNDQNQTHFPSAVHDSSSATNANTEARLLSQITRPRKPLLFTRSDADMQSGNVFTSSETGLRQKSSISLPGNNEGPNSSDSSSDTESPSPEYETTSKLKSKVGDSATPTLFPDSGGHSFVHSDLLPKPRRHLVMNTERQDSISDPIPDSPEGNDAKDYLRDSFVARRRQERRRFMFQQKKRAMDGFSLSSQSFTSLDDEQEANSSVPSSERTHSRTAPETSDRGKNKDAAASEYESLRSKTLTSLRSKFTVNKRSDVR